MNNTRPIAVIDRYQPTCESMADILRDEGYAAECLTQAATAETLRAIRPALIILDLQPIYCDDTLWLLDELRRFPATRATPVLITTTAQRLPEDLAVVLAQLGCSTIAKPFDIETLLAHVERALGSRQSVGSWPLLALA